MQGNLKIFMCLSYSLQMRGTQQQLFCTTRSDGKPVAQGGGADEVLGALHLARPQCRWVRAFLQLLYGQRQRQPSAYIGEPWHPHRHSQFTLTSTADCLTAYCHKACKFQQECSQLHNIA